MNMEKSKAPVFTLWIVAIIVGVALYKQFDFDSMRFKNTALAIVYMAVFVFSVYVLIKNRKKKTDG
jgi:uncharacterized membrane protein YccC